MKTRKPNSIKATNKALHSDQRGIRLNQRCFAKMVKKFEGYAKSTCIETEFANNAYWVFGSELEILRIVNKYRLSKAGQTYNNYSSARHKYYFVLYIFLKGGQHVN